MNSKKVLLTGGIILLVCLACALPAGALELNPMNYILKQPAPVQAVNKTLVNHAVGPVERVTVLPVVTNAASPVDVPAMSQVQSGPGACTGNAPPVTLEGVITEILYTDNWGTTDTVMKLSGGSEVLLYPADGGNNRDRVNHLFETAYIKGNRIHVTTTGGCSMVSFSGYEGITKQLPAYKTLFINLGPVHP